MLRNHSGRIAIPNPDPKGQPFTVAPNATVNAPEWVRKHSLIRELVNARREAGGIGGVELIEAT